MRSSPWLQDQTREGSILFYFSPMRQAWYNEGRINGRTFRLAMNSNVYSIIVFPKSCALNNSCRRVAFSIYGCKLYTIYYYYSLCYTLFLFLSSSIQFHFSSGMEKDGEKIKSKLKGRKKKTTKTKLRETLMSSSNFSNFETKNSEGRARREISPFTILEEKRYSFDFMKFEEIVGNHSTFTIENLFISENNAAVKFITSADT